MAELDRAGVLDGIRWAYRSATTRTLELYSEVDGDDAALLGSLRYTKFRDRLDRVFACDRYIVPDDDPAAGLDVLYDGLSDADSMPTIAPTMVERRNLNGSPGWAWEGKRFLLASCAFGKVDEIPWPRKSQTKQRVATQTNRDADQLELFDEIADEETGGLAAAMAAATAARSIDLPTFVLAHSLDPVSGQAELVWGRPQFNAGGGDAWVWRESLLSGRPPGGGRRIGPTPAPIGPNGVGDAPVRLRPRASEQSRTSASGEQ